MLFALECTSSALCLLSLEKNDNAYQLVHYDKRVLNHSSHVSMNILQEMCRHANATQVLLAIHDSRLLLRHFDVEAKTQHQIYQRCYQQLSQELDLNYYSWDAHPISDTQYLCAAIPLEKIILLQELCAACDLQIQVLEPSVCAIARASFYLLKLPQGLFLLYEHSVFTLMFTIKGSVIALRTFTKPEDLPENIASLPCSIDEIILIDIDPHTILPYFKVKEVDLLQYVQGPHPYGAQAANLQLLAPIGLMLRQDAS